MGEDEEATIRTLTTYREVMTTLIRRHRGRVVDAPGDNLLAEFASAVDAVQGAVEIQQELKGKNTELPAPRKVEFRIGINVGDVVVEGERLYGDGVNIAARLEGLAEPGGICISGTVLDHVKNKLALRYEDLGEQTVKNIAGPVRVWRVVMDEATAVLAKQFVLRQAQHERLEEEPAVGAGLALPKTRRVGTAHLSWPGVTLAGELLVAGTLLTVRYFSRPPLSPQSSALRRSLHCPCPTSHPLSCYRS